MNNVLHILMTLFMLLFLWLGSYS